MPNMSRQTTKDNVQVSLCFSPGKGTQDRAGQNNSAIIEKMEASNSSVEGIFIKEAIEALKFDTVCVR